MAPRWGSGHGERAGIRRGRIGGRAAGLLFQALVATLAAPRPATPAAQPELGGTVLGRVVEANSERAVVSAFVDILDPVGRIRERARTDGEGRFNVRDLAPGPFRIRVRSIGYAETTTPRWWIEGGDQVTMVVRVLPEAVLIAPLEVVTHLRRPSPMLAGFHERMNRVSGTFITRADVETSNAGLVTDLLATVLGVRLTNTGGLGRVLYFERALGDCPAQVWVDGVLATRAGPVAIDDLVGTDVLEGIEIYKGLASVPPEFYTPEARCGVIVLWTRRGPPTPSEVIAPGQ
ncbi:carboxypeptidase regulatory-like domain-containing protein [Gaopeijia maritima]|uniref:carboxypeptidase regulatory-like domain-containing protein n=1 Tax=Gaopeijia maritima TaxID=3119007 RepID=UPI00327868EB